MINIMIYAFRYSLLIVSLVALSACSKPEKTPTATPPPSSSTSNGNSSPLIAKEYRSPNFEPVAARLDLGGQNYTFMDFQGAMKQAGARITEMMLGLQQMDPSNPQMMMLSMIPFGPIIETLGASNLAAYGASSYVENGLYRNKSVVYMPEGVQGIFTLSGKEPTDFSGLAMAPKSTDFFLEYNFQSSVLLDMVYKVSELIYPGNGDKFAQGFLSARASDTAPTWEEILEKSNTLVNVVVRLGATVEVPIPEQDVVMEIPTMELVLSMKNMAWLVNDGVIPVDMMISSEEQGASVYRDGSGSIDTAGPYMEQWDPAIIVKGQDLFIVSHVAFWQECLASKTSLKDSAKFQEATAGFPEKGNALLFTSDKAFNAIVTMRDTLFAAEPQAAAGYSMMSLYVPILGIGPQDKSSAAIVTVDKESIFSDSRWPTPGGAGSSSFSSIPTIGLLAAMAIPAFQKVREQSREKAITNNLRQIASAGQQYILEEGATSVNYKKLEGEYFAPIISVNGEDYTTLVISEDGGVLEVTTINGKTVTYTY